MAQPARPADATRAAGGKASSEGQAEVLQRAAGGEEPESAPRQGRRAGAGRRAVQDTSPPRRPRASRWRSSAPAPLLSPSPCPQRAHVVVVLGVHLAGGHVEGGPHRREHAKDHPELGGVVDAQDLAGALTRKAVVHLGRGGRAPTAGVRARIRRGQRPRRHSRVQCCACCKLACWLGRWGCVVRPPRLAAQRATAAAAILPRLLCALSGERWPSSGLPAAAAAPLPLAPAPRQPALTSASAGCAASRAGMDTPAAAALAARFCCCARHTTVRAAGQGGGRGCRVRRAAGAAGGGRDGTAAKPPGPPCSTNADAARPGRWLALRASVRAARSLTGSAAGLGLCRGGGGGNGGAPQYPGAATSQQGGRRRFASPWAGREHSLVAAGRTDWLMRVACMVSACGWSGCAAELGRQTPGEAGGSALSRDDFMGGHGGPPARAQPCPAAPGCLG